MSNKLYDEDGNKVRQLKDLSKRELIQIYPKSEFLQFKQCLIKQLQLVTKVCEAYNVRYRVDCGTLLGLYRENDIIFPDFDNDIGVCMEDITPQFIAELNNLGLLRDLKSTMYWGRQEIIEAMSTDQFFKPKVLKVKDQTPTKRFFGSRCAITTDLFFWITNGDYQYSNLYSDMEMVQKCENIGQLQKVSTKHGDFYMPEHPDLYLADMYGDDWRIPNSAHKDIPGHVRGLLRRDVTGEVKYNWIQKKVRVDKFDGKPGKNAVEVVEQYNHIGNYLQ